MMLFAYFPPLHLTMLDEARFGDSQAAAKDLGCDANVPLLIQRFGHFNYLGFHDSCQETRLSYFLQTHVNEMTYRAYQGTTLPEP